MQENEPIGVMAPQQSTAMRGGGDAMATIVVTAPLPRQPGPASSEARSDWRQPKGYNCFSRRECLIGELP